MKKIISIIAVIALVITGVYAYGEFGQGLKENYDSDLYKQRAEYQNRMYEIVENGTYDELLDLRENSEITFVPWIDSEEDFKSWQEMHEEREEMGTAGKRDEMRGYGRGSHQRSGGNCMFN